MTKRYTISLLLLSSAGWSCYYTHVYRSMVFSLRNVCTAENVKITLCSIFSFYLYQTTMTKVVWALEGKGQTQYLLRIIIASPHTLSLILPSLNLFLILQFNLSKWNKLLNIMHHPAGPDGLKCISRPAFVPLSASVSVWWVSFPHILCSCYSVGYSLP